MVTPREDRLQKGTMQSVHGGLYDRCVDQSEREQTARSIRNQSPISIRVEGLRGPPDDPLRRARRRGRRETLRKFRRLTLIRLRRRRQRWSKTTPTQSTTKRDTSRSSSISSSRDRLRRRKANFSAVAVDGTFTPYEDRYRTMSEDFPF